MAERRTLARRVFSYYMRVMDEITGEPVGHLADISMGGFKLDCKNPLPPDTNLTMRIEQIGDIADKRFMVFTAQTRWCRQDEFDRTRYNVGFEIVDISESDQNIFVKMYDRYGVPKDASRSGVAGYTWQ